MVVYLDDVPGFLCSDNCAELLERGMMVTSSQNADSVHGSNLLIMLFILLVTGHFVQ